MNSDDLALFAHVAQSGSISRSAMDLGADQSTISRRIGLLEADLGVLLFQRTGRGVVLTERGEQLLAYATRLSDMLAEAQLVMRESSNRGPARLCIAAQPTIAWMLFGKLGHTLKERFPDTKLCFVEGLASQILPRLAEGEIDLAILYLAQNPGGLQFDVLLQEEIHLITPPDSPLAGESVDVAALGGLPLILPSTHHGLRQFVETLAARHGFAANIALECDGSISLTKRLVSEGCGNTVLPKAAVVEEIARGQLRSLRLDPPATRNVAIVWPRNRFVHQGNWGVAQTIRRIAGQMVRSGAWPDTRLQPAAAPGESTETAISAG